MSIDNAFQQDESRPMARTPVSPVRARRHDIRFKNNRLLNRLPARVIDKLVPYFEYQTLQIGVRLHSPGDQIKFCYFPLTCMISITATMLDGMVIEAGAVGNREMAGVNAMMGESPTTRTSYVIQLAGEVIKLPVEPLRLAFDNDPETRQILLAYTQAMIAHVSQNVACNRAHPMDQRCARWLLEVSDRVGGIDFKLSQEFISQMLGVTRSTLNRSMHKLKLRRLIDYSRTKIMIIDLPGLEAISCECYGVLRDEYDRLLGPL